MPRPENYRLDRGRGLFVCLFVFFFFSVFIVLLGVVDVC